MASGASTSRRFPSPRSAGVPRALVTGATGLVGSHIVERLLARRMERARARAIAVAELVETLGVEIVTGDVLDADSVRARGDGMRRHLPHRGGDHAERRLGGVSPAERRRNANAIAAARAIGRATPAAEQRRRVRAGRALPRRPAHKTDEDTPLAPLPERAYYARSKRESEQLVMRRARRRTDLGDGAFGPT